MVQQQVIGLIGGLSWESSVEYYRLINERVRERLGGMRSARCLMWSFDFAEIEALQHAQEWERATSLMIMRTYLHRSVVSMPSRRSTASAKPTLLMHGDA